MDGRVPGRPLQKGPGKALAECFSEKICGTFRRILCPVKSSLRHDMAVLRQTIFWIYKRRAGIMIARQRNPARLLGPPRCAGIIPDPQLAEKMPPAASLSPLRMRYNDCAAAQSGPITRAAPLRGDYTRSAACGENAACGVAFSSAHAV